MRRIFLSLIAGFAALVLLYEAYDVLADVAHGDPPHWHSLFATSRS